MTFKIEKGIPAPRSRGNPKYPWDSMEVGDSFFVPGKSRKALASAASSAKKAFSRAGWNFKTAEEEGGSRVWRTA